MTDYKRMYAILCGAISDALDDLDKHSNLIISKSILENALLRTEEMYISSKQN